MAEAIAEYDIFFLETPLWVDDLAGYAELARRSPVRIAQGEWLTTRFEFAALIDGGCVQVVAAGHRPRRRPDRGAARRAHGAPSATCSSCPHAWKTGISVAVAAHLAMVTPQMPFFEFLPAELCESRLRKELVHDELVYRDGDARRAEQAGPRLRARTADALEEFAEAARRVTPEALR